MPGRAEALLRGATAACALLATAILPSSASAAATEGEERASVRIAVFNIRELSTAKLTRVDAEGSGTDPQALAAARILQTVRPDIVVVQEIDAVFRNGEPQPEVNARRFAESYLARGDDPIDFPHIFAAPTNTGVGSGVDLDGDGEIADAGDLGTRVWGGDSLGWGEYPGQYSMAVLSRWPVDRPGARTFRELLWRDLPGHHLPPDYYSPEAVAVLPLSSKSHWDVPIVVDGRRLHLWISHPTPGVFDGEEDRNGRRNFDEIRFWTLYPKGWKGLRDDQGRPGGRSGDAPFVVLGDLNADPGSETSFDGLTAIAYLLENLSGLQDPGSICASAGALGDRELGPPDFPERSTAAFGTGMRLDYVLPSAVLRVVDGGVFWPDPEQDPEGSLLAETASDHRLVWIDVELP